VADSSLVSLPGSGLPVLPGFVFRRRLEAERTRLLELKRCCPPGCRYGLADALEAVEDTMAGLGWHYPPLTEHDREFLAAVERARNP
jgi:hypothetical protein